VSGTVVLRGVELGRGRAKVAASLTSATREELVAEAGRLVVAAVDVAEWRVDLAEPGDLAATLHDLRAALGDVPLLVTARSTAEGGRRDLADEDWLDLVRAVAATGDADAVDVEVARPAAVLAETVRVAHAAGLAVVASSHDLAGTPPAADVVGLLARMAGLGADVAKVAVTARTAGDVVELLAATATACERLAVPVVTMAMGPLGLVTRLAGETFGSALTFGALDRASAPGQVPVAELRPVVDLVHRELGGS
jgi:3-dehydroquinate dehydratase-1